MAGGTGTRFWPKSTSKHPKQFLKLFGKETMIQQTVNRLAPDINSENVLVVTNADYIPFVENQLPSVPAHQIIGEPVARNTAPCVAAAAAILHKIDPESTMIVLPADHKIEDRKTFLDVLKGAGDLAGETESLITIGIRPNRPETGYGYIKYNSGKKNEAGKYSAYSVQNFTEKPNLETAKTFLKSGDYVWNSGMFIWKTSAILNAFEQHLPEIYELTQKLIKSEMNDADVEDFYQVCPSVSVDYGIMEKAENVYVLTADFGWSDLGTWGSLYTHVPQDDHKNAVIGKNVMLYNCVNNMVNVPKEKLVVLQGLNGYIVVESNDTLLVCKKEDEQKIKTMVQDIKIEKGDKYV
jgi:mannose-1-phosphate guanylyltransferase